MAGMGHTDPGLALKVYAQAMRRDEHQIAKLRAPLRALRMDVWANVWANGTQTPPPERMSQHPQASICRHKRP